MLCAWGLLGLFIHQCILWLDPAEREEHEGLIGRLAKGVQNAITFICIAKLDGTVLTSALQPPSPLVEPLYSFCS
jgi:hypothetical protein